MAAVTAAVKSGCPNLHDRSEQIHSDLQDANLLKLLFLTGIVHTDPTYLGTCANCLTVIYTMAIVTDSSYIQMHRKIGMAVY